MNLKDASIIFELVLIGFQIIIWVFLLVLAVFGYRWIDLSALLQWSAQVSVALVGVAYMFGLIFDKAVGALPYSWVVGGGALTQNSDDPTPLIMRMEILSANPGTFEILEKRVNQHRLVRSTVFNLALICISALVFFFAQMDFDIRFFTVFLCLSALFVGLALFTGRRSAETLYLELLHSYQKINESKKGKLLLPDKPEI